MCVCVCVSVYVSAVSVRGSVSVSVCVCVCVHVVTTTFLLLPSLLSFLTRRHLPLYSKRTSSLDLSQIGDTPITTTAIGSTSVDGVCAEAVSEAYAFAIAQLDEVDTYLRARWAVAG